MMNKGFSLIELLIVVTILGILAAFSYSSYRDSIVRARRSDGQTALVELANRLELYYSEQQSYQGATLGTGNASDVSHSIHSPQNWYRLVIALQTDSTFTLHAIPRNAQAHDDLLCQTLTFNSFGVKGIIAGPSGIPTGITAQCW